MELRGPGPGKSRSKDASTNIHLGAQLARGGFILERFIFVKDKVNEWGTTALDDEIFLLQYYGLNDIDLGPNFFFQTGYFFSWIFLCLQTSPKICSGRLGQNVTQGAHIEEPLR